MKRLLWLLTILTMGFLADMNGKELDPIVKSMLTRFPRGEWLPIELAIPENFLVKPLNLDADCDLVSWWVMGDEETIQDLWKQIQKNPNASMNPRHPALRVKLANGIYQKNEKEFSESDSKLIEDLKPLGIKNIKLYSISWGEAPVKVLEGTDLLNRPLRMAWVGMGPGAPCLLMNLMLPMKEGEHKEALAIWEKFIKNSKFKSIEEHYKYMEKNCLEMQKEGCFLDESGS